MVEKWRDSEFGHSRHITQITVKTCFQFSSIQSLHQVWLFGTPWTAARQVSLSITNSWSLLKLMSIELVIPSNHLILCHPLLFLPSIFPSIRVFSNESVHIRWPKYCSFSFSISPSNEYLRLISFRMDWLDLLAVQGTLEGLEHHSAKASILWHLLFFMVQLSYLYTSLIAQLVKNPPALQETLVWFLGQKYSLEKGLATHSSILGVSLWLIW